MLRSKTERVIPVLGGSHSCHVCNEALHIEVHTMLYLERAKIMLL